MSVRVRHPSSVNVHSRRSRAVNHQDSAATHLGVKVIRRNVMAANRIVASQLAMVTIALTRDAAKAPIVAAERTTTTRVGAIQTIGLAEANQVVANRVAMTLAATRPAGIVKTALVETGILQTPASVATPQAVTAKDSKQEPGIPADATDRHRPCPSNPIEMHSLGLRCETKTSRTTLPPLNRK
jgi:hypothetical protein